MISKWVLWSGPIALGKDFLFTLNGWIDCIYLKNWTNKVTIKKLFYLIKKSQDISKIIPQCLQKDKWIDK